MTILFALLSVAIGALLLLGGYRLARIAIPLLGFVAGLSLGGAVFSNMASTPFLGSILGVFIGLLSGLFFAALAYFYYYVAVIVLTAGLGYWMGSGFILLLGFSPGILSALAGIALGAVAGFAGLAFNAPRYVLILLTSIAGAVASVGGIMLLFHTIPLEAYNYTTAHLAISNSFLWSLTALALFAIGLVVQATTTTGYHFEEWAMSEGTSGHQVPPTSAPHHHGV